MNDAEPGDAAGKGWLLTIAGSLLMGIVGQPASKSGQNYFNLQSFLPALSGVLLALGKSCTVHVDVVT